MLYEDYGDLRPIIYKNVIHLAIREGQVAWAATFCESQKEKLPPADKNDLYRLCKAIIDFETANFNKIISGIVNLSFTTVSFECNRRTLLTCAYYELMEKGKDANKYADLLEKNNMNMVKYLQTHRNSLTESQFLQYDNFSKMINRIRKHTHSFTLLYKENPQKHEKKIELLSQKKIEITCIMYKTWLLKKVMLLK